MDSSPVLSRRQALGTRESEILTRWTRIDEFLEAIAARMEAVINSGVDSPRSFAWIPATLIVEVTEDFLASTTEAVNRRGLWFLVMAYLDARQEPRRRYTLSDDESSCLRWMLPDRRGFERGEDDVLAPRELVALYLYGRAGRAPDWFQPMPEA